MSRCVVLYRMPPDAADFEQRYRQTHLPIVRRTPGLISVELSKVTKTVLGEPLFLVAELRFAGPEDLRAGMRSPEWAASGRNLAEIGALELATIVLLDDPEIFAADSGEGNTGEETTVGSRSEIDHPTTEENA